MDKILKNTIEKYYKEVNNVEIIINNIKIVPTYYYIKCQKKYFDGGGYMWSNEATWKISKRIIDPYLRNYKIKKLKSNG